MPATSLPFYRKNQSLLDMETERPKSMAALRQAVLSAASEIEENARALTREFTGCCPDGGAGGGGNDGVGPGEGDARAAVSFRSHETELRDLLPSLRHLMNTLEYTYLNSAVHLDVLVEQTLEPSEVFRFDKQAAEKVRDYHRKLLEFMPERMEPLLNDSNRILKHLRMYCLSFCPPHVSNDTKKLARKYSYLETPIHYKLKCIDFAKTIQMHLDNISNMSKVYRLQDGVTSKHFGLTANELARSCDCGDVPFVLIFPEACFNIHYACATIRKWIEADKEYTEFIKHDIERLESRKLEHSSKVHNSRTGLAGLESEIRSTRSRIAQIEQEMANMTKREKQVNNETERLETHIKVQTLELEHLESEQARVRLKETTRPEVTESQVVDRLTELAEKVAKIRQDIPDTRTKILAVKNKQKIVIDKRELLGEKIKDLQSLDKQRILAKGYLHDAKEEQDKIESALLIQRDIYVKRTSPDLTKKIFNSMPVQPRNLRHMAPRPRALRQRPDPLDRATRIVSKRIEGNWEDLYRSLPFYPPRGDIQKDTDIDMTSKQLYRSNDSHKAAVALENWRKRDTIANVESLKATLRKMGRKDIAEELDKTKRKSDVITGHKADAKVNWKKLQKFRSAFGKVLAVQKKTHKNKLGFTTEKRYNVQQKLRESSDETESDVKSVDSLTNRRSNYETPRNGEAKVSFNLPKINAY